MCPAPSASWLLAVFSRGSHDQLGPNLGKKPSKSLMDRTICRSSTTRMSESAVLNRRYNRQ
jgi:hypothetical protein